jgi:dolichyl-phosphate-mannose--protein O-mannosyl transferase
VQVDDDSNSLWIIKEQMGKPPCETGTPIMCGQLIRLEHVNTGKNLHSHYYPSFITDSQEASCFGDDDGNGDINDNFQLICQDNKERHVVGATKFYLFHIGTKHYLYINIRKSLFNEYNCRGCPILGQREVSLTPNHDMQSLWKIAGVIDIIFKLGYYLL